MLVPIHYLKSKGKGRREKKKYPSIARQILAPQNEVNSYRICNSSQVLLSVCFTEISCFKFLSHSDDSQGQIANPN